jgi:hypothetical protein
MHWKSDRRDEDINAWYDLIFLTQFKSLKSKAAALAAAPFTDASRRKIAALRRTGERLSKIRYFINKGRIILLGISGGLKRC